MPLIIRDTFDKNELRNFFLYVSLSFIWACGGFRIAGTALVQKKHLRETTTEDNVCAQLIPQYKLYLQ